MTDESLVFENENAVKIHRLMQMISMMADASDRRSQELENMILDLSRQIRTLGKAVKSLGSEGDADQKKKEFPKRVPEVSDINDLV
ncbi:MAG TPA: hypothetical protein VEH06_00175 [Candidatus Bathyarchaeia archaeon]|nr:hypothetical protein [Candidatus Bathyarchaeia archaeon]